MTFPVTFDYQMSII